MTQEQAINDGYERRTCWFSVGKENKFETHVKILYDEYSNGVVTVLVFKNEVLSDKIRFIRLTGEIIENTRY